MNLNFRSALNGFNRQDVARYLEYLNTQHNAQLNQLQTDLDNLRRKAEPEGEDPREKRLRELENKCMELETQLAAMQAGWTPTRSWKLTAGRSGPSGWPRSGPTSSMPRPALC